MSDTTLRLFGESSRPWSGPTPHAGEYIDNDGLWLVATVRHHEGGVDVFCNPLSDALADEFRRRWENWESGEFEPAPDHENADLPLFSGVPGNA